MKRSFLITTLVTSHLLTSVSPCVAQSTFCNDFEECKTAFHTKMSEISSALDGTTNEEAKEFVKLAFQLDTFSVNGWNQFVVAFRKMFLSEAYAEENKEAASFIKSFLTSGLSKAKATEIYNGLHVKLEAFIAQYNSEKEEALRQEEERKATEQALHQNAEKATPEEIVLEEGTDCPTVLETTCASNTTNTLPPKPFLATPQLPICVGYSNETMTENGFSQNPHFVTLTSDEGKNEPNLDNKSTEFGSGQIYVDPNIPTPVGIDISASLSDAPLNVTEPKTPEPTVTETSQQTPVQDNIVLPELPQPKAPAVVFFDTAGLTLTKHVFADLRKQIGEKVEDDFKNSRKTALSSKRYAMFKNVNGADKILAYDALMRQKVAIISMNGKTNDEKIQAWLGLEAIKGLLDHEKDLRERAQPDVMDSEYLNMFLTGSSAENTLRKKNKEPLTLLAKHFKKNNPIYKNMPISDIIADLSKPDKLKKNQKDYPKLNIKTSKDYLIFRQESIYDCFKMYQPIALIIEDRNAQNMRLSHEAMKVSFTQFQSIHEATIGQIKFLREHATDTATKALVKAKNPLAKLHIQINKTMSFDFEGSSQKENAIHKRELLTYLDVVKSTYESTVGFYKDNFIEQSPETPHLSLILQYNQLISILRHMTQLIQNHLDEHMAHVTAASISSLNEDAKSGWAKSEEKILPHPGLVPGVVKDR